jgi:hypothetical protein
MPTLDEIEEALRHLRDVPADERGAAWHAYCDSLLEQRVALAATPAQRRETRVVQFSEAR